MVENNPEKAPIQLKELLKPRWNNLCQSLGISSNQETFEQLCGHYSEPHRAYHTLDHLDKCFQEFGEVKSFLHNPNAVELAIWFHDIIYDIGQKDNEEKSAQLARDFCQNNGLSESFTKEVEEHILATKNHELSVNPDTNYLIDIDMSILGYPAEAMYQYE